MNTSGFEREIACFLFMPDALNPRPLPREKGLPLPGRKRSGEGRLTYETTCVVRGVPPATRRASCYYFVSICFTCRAVVSRRRIRGCLTNYCPSGAETSGPGGRLDSQVYVSIFARASV